MPSDHSPRVFLMAMNTGDAEQRLLARMHQSPADPPPAEEDTNPLLETAKRMYAPQPPAGSRPATMG